jgi:hypothetical protein
MKPATIRRRRPAADGPPGEQRSGTWKTTLDGSLAPWVFDDRRLVDRHYGRCGLPLRLPKPEAS